MHYEEYYELTEKTGWRITDFDWDQLVVDAKAGLLSDFDRAALLATAVIEHGVPHYGEVWTRVAGLTKDWELWQFTTLWTGEEHRHSYALKKACHILGIENQIEADLLAVATFPFAAEQKKSCPEDCYSSIPGMLTYAMIQELVTNKFYTYAAKQATSKTLKDLILAIAQDEMRHHVFFREALKERYETSTDKAWFSDQCFQASNAFKMPHVIYGLQHAFFEDGPWSALDEVMPQLARAFSFDMQLLMRLAQVASSRGAQVVPTVPSPQA
jgi:Fatty acid desaturase